MKKTYIKPEAEKVDFNQPEVVTASFPIGGKYVIDSTGDCHAWDEAAAHMAGGN